MKDGFTPSAIAWDPAGNVYPTGSAVIDQVDVTLPATLLPCAQNYSQLSAENSFAVTFSFNGAPVGPRVVPVPNGGPIIDFAPGEPMPMIVSVRN